ncbi:helix-turn-helix domain-containing protein [Brevundimonas sp. A19_0]|uniref:helix-turn-helix domain-containing protein n=1 Tax=Brevundimonas sp. A19_0 TaxID=2821087 RepID=UPI001ADC9795|nr:helix-turn-helix transcriptional regulator [Brevundimonas sp. A19_0]
MGSVLPFPGTDPADAAIGRRLKHWRGQRGVDVDSLAGALKLTPEALRRLEAGHARMDSMLIAAATRHLHLPVWALVSDTRAY